MRTFTRRMTDGPRAIGSRPIGPRGIWLITGLVSGLMITGQLTEFPVYR